MVMQPINEDAKQGGTEWAALPEPNGWTLAVATMTIDPHRQQRAIIQGLRPTCGHAPPSAVASPKEAATGPYHRLIRGPQNTGTKVFEHVCACHSMLKGEGRMDGAKLWPVACLGGRSQLLRLCVCDKALYHDAGV
ncbi:TPA: hypothetical protein ACH3X1_008476 [Trebouxia sp. C0004]